MHIPRALFLNETRSFMYCLHDKFESGVNFCVENLRGNLSLPLVEKKNPQKSKRIETAKVSCHKYYLFFSEFVVVVIVFVVVSMCSGGLPVRPVPGEGSPLGKQSSLGRFSVQSLVSSRVSSFYSCEHVFGRRKFNNWKQNLGKWGCGEENYQTYVKRHCVQDRQSENEARSILPGTRMVVLESASVCFALWHVFQLS